MCKDINSDYEKRSRDNGFIQTVVNWFTDGDKAVTT